MEKFTVMNNWNVCWLFKRRTSRDQRVRAHDLAEQNIER